MSWANHKLPVTCLTGLDRNKFKFPDDELDETDDRYARAKKDARIMIQGAMPQWVKQAGGADLFFDTLADSSSQSVQDALNGLLSDLFAQNCFRACIVSPGDRYDRLTMDLKPLIKAQVKGLSDFLPTEMGLTAKSPNTSRMSGLTVVSGFQGGSRF